MEYRSVSDCLAGYWDKAWQELPDKQRQAWREALLLQDLDSRIDSAEGPCQPAELVLWDTRSAEQRQYVAACHDSQDHSEDNQEERTAFQGGFYETANNGHPIKWRYWTRFHTLTAHQFSCLASGLDPDTVSADRPRPMASDSIQKAKAIEQLARNQGKTEATAHDWLKWAADHGFNIFQRCRLAFATAPVTEITDTSEATPHSAEQVVAEPLATKTQLVQSTKPSATTEIGIDYDSPCAVFRSMPSLRSPEVVIEFVAGNAGGTLLIVKARGESKRMALTDLDLWDHRKGEMNMQGKLLLRLANKEHVRNLSDAQIKQVCRLRLALQETLGITDKVIVKNGADYEPLFAVTDRRGAADERAKREAVRKTESYVEARLYHQHSGATRDFDRERDDTDSWLKENDPNY